MQVKGSGSDFTTSTASIGADAFSEVTPPSRYNSCLIRCRSAVDVYIKRKSADSTYFTIPSGQALELDINGSDAQTFFLKSGTGTVTVEIMWTR